VAGANLEGSVHGLLWGGQETSGTLLDSYPAGPILRSVAGAKTLISWDRLVLCEPVED